MGAGATLLACMIFFLSNSCAGIFFKAYPLHQFFLPDIEFSKHFSNILHNFCLYLPVCTNFFLLFCLARIILGYPPSPLTLKKGVSFKSGKGKKIGKTPEQLQNHPETE